MQLLNLKNGTKEIDLVLHFRQIALVIVNQIILVMATKAIVARADKNVLMAYHSTVDANQQSRYLLLLEETSQPVNEMQNQMPKYLLSTNDPDNICGIEFIGKRLIYAAQESLNPYEEMLRPNLIHCIKNFWKQLIKRCV